MSDDAIQKLLYRLGADITLTIIQYPDAKQYREKKLTESVEEAAQQIRSIISEKEFEAYKRGVEDEIKCVENSGEHVDLQAKLAQQRKLNQEERKKYEFTEVRTRS